MLHARIPTKHSSFLSRLALAAFMVTIPACSGEACGYPLEDAARSVKYLIDAAEQFRWRHADRCPLDTSELVEVGRPIRPALDPWGHPYTISCTSTRIRVCSTGADQHERADDICAEHIPSIGAVLIPATLKPASGCAAGR
jgi:hypothetical protein